MSIATSSIPKFLLLLLLLSVPRLGFCEDEEGGDDTENVKQKYFVAWAKTPPIARTSSDWVDFNPDIESVNCSSDNNCTAALYDLDVALSYHSNLPSAPYCLLPREDNSSESWGVGLCTCGPGRCVSYSRNYAHNNDPFYYCGPCGWVGSQCNTTCTHYLADCRGGYCECVKDGIFYDLSYCYIPYYGKELAMEMMISTGIIMLCCVLLAYGYTRLGRRRSRRSSYLDRWTRGSVTQESPADDTPPTYDDVVDVAADKLPSYQDALEMAPEPGEDGGVINSAFQPDSAILPSDQEDYKPANTPASKPDNTDPTPTLLSTAKPDYTFKPTPSPITPPDTQTNTGNLSRDEFPPPPEGDSAGQQEPTASQTQPIQQPLQAALTDLQTKPTFTPDQYTVQLDPHTNSVSSST